MSENKKQSSSDKRNIAQLSAGDRNTDGCCGKLPDFLGGFVFIIAGVILILNNFNIIPWTIWVYLLRFWSVVFVFIGLKLISENSWTLKIITTIIGIFILLLILLYALSASDPNFNTYISINFPRLHTLLQKIPVLDSEKYINPSNPRSGYGTFYYSN